MEPLGAMSEGEWRSLSGMCSTDEEDAFMAQLLGNCSLPNELRNISNFGVSSSFWTGHESTTNMGGGREVSVFSSNDTNNSMYGGGSSFHCPVSSQEGYYPCHSKPILMRNDSSITMEYGQVEGQSIGSSSHDVFPYNQVEAADFLNQDVSNDSMEFDEHITESVLDGQGLQLGRRDYDQFPEDHMDDGPSDSSKKRSRLQGHGHVPKSKRSPKLQKDSKIGEMDRKNKAVLQRQNSMISCCSEDESNVSHELNGRKTRASRGSATDPQSLYARKRRERINERLKTLQCLIPNGTKVDISTMLEEAVLYVKFLQLQIKLLSSDDHWMYAPIAYNGMDIGLDLKISLPK